jgi:hypothetical protein
MVVEEEQILALVLVTELLVVLAAVVLTNGLVELEVDKQELLLQHQ